MRKHRLIVGNWKMNMDLAGINYFLQRFADEMRDSHNIFATNNTVVGLAVPTIYLSEVISLVSAKKLPIEVYAQNVFYRDHGAFTGEISAPMLVDVKAAGSLIGHSERRSHFFETDKSINSKVQKCLQLGLKVILCVGENAAQYESGLTNQIIRTQLNHALRDVPIEKHKQNFVIAYEPLWAIGTGKTATPTIAQGVLNDIRNWVFESYGHHVSEEIHLQYGGSVNPSNIKHILGQPDIDGVLIGGASLDIESFLKLV